MHNDLYFGKSERDLFGSLISEACPGWIISKKVADCDARKDYSLVEVANMLSALYPEQCSGSYTVTFGTESETAEFNLFTILGALEGMCYNNEAVEVADGYYYVGSYADWHNDKEAQAELDNLRNS